MNVRCCLSTVSLVAIAGTALATPPTTDGILSPGEYPFIRWAQNVPTQFGDNHPTSGCDNSAVGNPGAVATGIEFKIPLAAIGNPTGSVRVCAFVNSGGHSDVSNQVLGGVPPQRLSLGEPRDLDFSSIANNQFVTATAVSGSDPVIDGALDSNVYGAVLATQTNRTSFGDNNVGDVANANGSELDNVYAVIRNGSLFIFIGGNLSADFTKLDVFIDTGTPGGYNRLPTGLPDVDFHGLERMADDGSGNGLKFDAAFTADYYLKFTAGGDPITCYADYADLNALVGRYLGNNTPGSGGALSGGDNPDGIEIALDNSNTAGVPAACPIPEGDKNQANGSEIDNVYATVDGSRLYVFIGGNLESNFNRLDLFLDVGTGGQNTIGKNPADNSDVTNPNVHFNSLQAGKLAGLTFDTDFFAGYYITIGCNATQMYVDACVLRPDGRRADGSGYPYDYGSNDGGNKPASPPHVIFDGPAMDGQDGSKADIYSNYPPRLGGDRCYDASPGNPDPNNPFPLTGLLKVSLDNRNIDGVQGYPDGDWCDAANVVYGVEFEIDLAELGWDPDSGVPIKLAGFINGGSHNYLSNQVIGGLPAGTPNLATASAVNFANIPGNQYVLVSNCPADFNGDNFVSGEDFDVFVVLFEAGDPLSDFDHNCFPNGDDFDKFITFFEAGC